MRLVYQTRFSFTIVALFVRRRWQSISAILSHSFWPENLERIQKEAIYQSRVFFIRNLGFVTPTAARRISFNEMLRFETIHERHTGSLASNSYRSSPASLKERLSIVKSLAYNQT